MADDLKKMYRTVMDDHFPPEMKVSFGDQTLVYRKRAWKIRDEKSGDLIEKGLRYGENPVYLSGYAVHQCGYGG